MQVLLDTHAFLWWLAGDKQMSRKAKTAIGDSEVYVSAASAWEISTKYRLGKLPGVESIVGDLAAVIATQAFTPLPITLTHAQRAGSLHGNHRDPFDRMLIAQAQLDGLALVSNEEIFDAYGITRIW